MEKPRNEQSSRYATQPCGPGCVIRNRHSSSCGDPTGCPGCLPRHTEPGLAVCRRCYWLTSDALYRIPDLVAHLRDNITPGAAPVGERVDTSASLPVPLNLTAVDDADLVHSRLAAWALHIAATNPGLGAPPMNGSTIVPCARRHIAGVHLTRCDTPWCPGCYPAYEDARIVGTRGDWRATLTLTRWVRDRMDWALTQDWGPDMAAEFTGTVRVVSRRWPTEEKPTYLPVPCPVCKLPSLVRYAPRVFGGPVTVVCQSCGDPLPERTRP